MANSTVFDINGLWTQDGQQGALITIASAPPPFDSTAINGNVITVNTPFTVNMSDYPALGSADDPEAYTRPDATGNIEDVALITINFPDDQGYTATLVPGEPDTILFSNGSTWTRVASFWGGDTLVPIEGRWAYGGVPGPFIGPPAGNIYPVSMKAYGRGDATLQVESFGTVSARFVDPVDEGEGFLRLSRTLAWKNSSEWTWVAPTFTARATKFGGEGVQLQITGSNYPGSRVLLVTITPDKGAPDQEPVTTDPFGGFILDVPQPRGRYSIAITPQTGPSPFVSALRVDPVTVAA